MPRLHEPVGPVLNGPRETVKQKPGSLHLVRRVGRPAHILLAAGAPKAGSGTKGQ